MLVNCAVRAVNANTSGRLSSIDIYSTIHQIEHLDHPGILLNYSKWPDLVREDSQIQSRFERDGIISYQTNNIPSDSAIVFDLNRLFIFEKRPITVRLYPVPERDGWGVTITRRYMPAISNRNSVIKIANC